MSPLPYAEDVNYWKTGQSAPDTWLDHAKTEIAAAGGAVYGANGSVPMARRRRQIAKGMLRVE